MVNKVLKYWRWGKNEARLAILLTVILLSEITAMILLDQGFGHNIAKLLAPLVTGLANGMGNSLKWVFRMVGPVLLPLIILTIGEAWCLWRLAKLWRSGLECGIPKTLDNLLKIVEGAGPGFGFVGTCLSLTSTMSALDPSLNQAAMLKALLDNSSSAFGSTIYGLSLAIVAFLSREIFGNFLLISKPPKQKDKKQQENYQQTYSPVVAMEET